MTNTVSFFASFLLVKNCCAFFGEKERGTELNLIRFFCKLYFYQGGSSLKSTTWLIVAQVFLCLYHKPGRISVATFERGIRPACPGTEVVLKPEQFRNCSFKFIPPETEGTNMQDYMPPLYI